MVSDTISANRGVWFADEPFAMFPDRKGFREKSLILFKPKHSHFFDLRGEELVRFEEFSLRLLQARLRSLGTARQTLPMLKANRTCAKILNAPWMLDWFASNTNANIIALLRHPGAQARSVLRQGWAFPAEAYIERPDSLRDKIGDSNTEKALQIWYSGSEWQRAVLDWIITSAPLRSAKGERVYRLHYEDIVLSPASFIDEILIKKFALTDRDAMHQSMMKPSGSAHLNTAFATKSISNRNLPVILNGWRDGIDGKQMTEGQFILDTFGVSKYRFDENCRWSQKNID